MLTELRALIAVADTGSVQAAGERILRTQPATTRQLQRLERNLGVKLFDRTRKPHRLTGDGVLALNHARRVIAQYDYFMDAFGRQEPTGPLRLGIAQAANGSRCAAALGALRARHPDLNLQIFSGWSGDLKARVESSELDAAIVLTVEPLRKPAKSSFAIIDTADKAARKLSLGEAAQRPWVLSPEPCEIRRWLTSAFIRAGSELRIGAEVQDPRLQAEFVAQGMGLGVLALETLAETTATVGQIEVAELSMTARMGIERGRSLGRMAPVIDELVGLLAGSISAGHSGF